MSRLIHETGSARCRRGASSHGTGGHRIGPFGKPTQWVAGALLASTSFACVPEPCEGDGGANDCVNDGSMNDGPIPDGTINDGNMNDGIVSDGGPNDGSVGDGAVNDGEAGETSTLSVLVVDPLGYPVPGAIVSIGGRSADSTSQGVSLFANLPAGRVVGVITASGYADASVVIDLPPGVSASAQKIVVPLRPATRIDPGSTAVVSQGEVSVTIPANSLYDGNNLVTGPVDVTITPVDPTLDISSAPGPMEGIDSTNQSVILDSVFMADVSAWQNGRRLTFNPPDGGVGATVEMPVPPNVAANSGDTIPAWSYDVGAGTWRQEGTGTVSRKTSGSYRGRVWRAEIRHFTWWNCDHPDSEKTCVRVTVESVPGTPRAGALVQVTGLDYQGVSQAKLTDATGSACSDFKLGSRAKVAVQLASTPFPSEAIAGGTTQATCTGNPSDCSSLLIRPSQPPTCVTGTVRLGDGGPAVGAGVAADSALTDTIGAVADSSGGFCFNVPSGVALSLHAADATGGQTLGASVGPFDTGTTPASCATGGCTDHSMTLAPLPATACFETTLTANGTALPAGTPFQVFLGSQVPSVDCSSPASTWPTLLQGVVGADGHACFELPLAADAGVDQYTVASICKTLNVPVTGVSFTTSGAWFGACGIAGSCRELRAELSALPE